VSDDKLTQRNPKLVECSTHTDLDNAKKAIDNVPKSLWGYAKHSDETDVIGQAVVGIPEPKTDIIFGENNEYRVSVKMDGSIQLASGEGTSSAKMLNAAMSEYLQQFNGTKDHTMEDIIQRIEGMPTKSIDLKNFEKAKTKRPKLFETMLDEQGNLYPFYDWKKWEKENKKKINDYLAIYTANNPEFLYILIDEALTGKRTFGEKNLATANYIITPTEFVKIDSEYVKKVAKGTKITVRAKSRKGITSAALRFDYTNTP